MTIDVALVGAGPGDPELLTLRAASLLAEADLVIVDSSLEHLARDAAPQATVVAAPDGAAPPQIVLAAAERAPGPVVRLYRGDPWLHPAYEGERMALTAAGYTVEAVAGVAVEVAVPALAGIAVHLRHVAVACTLGPVDALPAACDPARTLVASADDPVAMACAAATAGDPRLPAFLVSLAAPAERWRGLLGEANVAAGAVSSPAVLVVGAVCEVPVHEPVAAASGACGADDRHDPVGSAG